MAEKNSQTETEMDASKRTLNLSRYFQAPREWVYSAWIEPEKMMRWYGPAGAQTLLAESDPRVGGRYRVLMRTPDGKEHDVSGVFREVVPNAKLVFTWTWTSTPERESVVTVQFASEGSGTRMTFKHEQLFDELDRDNHGNGWGGAFDNLEKSLANWCES
jgi:uncharacterized protein YndB with AHSA1/START domain